VENISRKLDEGVLHDKNRLRQCRSVTAASPRRNRDQRQPIVAAGFREREDLMKNRILFFGAADAARRGGTIRAGQHNETASFFGMARKNNASVCLQHVENQTLTLFLVFDVITLP